jgi:hypothetical protein
MSKRRLFFRNKVINYRIEKFKYLISEIINKGYKNIKGKVQRN